MSNQASGNTATSRAVAVLSICLWLLVWPLDVISQTDTGPFRNDTRRVISAAERDHKPQSKELARALEPLLESLREVGRLDEAAAVARRILAIQEHVYGPKHPEVANTLSDLGNIALSSRQYALALPLFERSLAIREQALGPNHEGVAAILDSLGALHKASNQYVRALPILQRSLAINERALGPNHVNVARSLNNLANLYVAANQYALALPLYKRSQATYERALGPDHEEVALSLSNLAKLFYATGNYPEALPLYERSLSIRQKAKGPDHVDVADSLSELAALYTSTGQYAKAATLYQNSLAIYEKALGPDHEEMAQTLSDLAVLYTIAKQYAQALPLLQRSLAIREKALGHENIKIAWTLHNLAELYRATGQYALALPLLQRSAGILERSLGPMHVDVATSLHNQALMYTTVGEYARALPLYQRSLEIKESRLGRDNVVVASSLNNLANLFEVTGQPGQALPMYRRGLAISERALGPDHVEVATILNNLATLHYKSGQYAQALPLYQRSLEIAEGNPAARELHWGVLANLAAMSEAQGQTETSIFLGKLAVNRLQELRDLNRKLGEPVSASYLETRRWVYTRLVSQLLAQGRFGEAETVLQMQRERELYEDVTRGIEQPQPTQRTVPLTANQQAQAEALRRSTLAQASQMQEFKALTAKQLQGSLSAAEQARLATLSPVAYSVGEDLKAFWSGLNLAFASSPSSSGPLDVKGAQTDLATLVANATRSNPGAPVVALQYVVAPKELVIVVTASELPQPLRVALPLGKDKESDLRQLATEFNVAISGAGSSPARVQELGAKLHKLLIEPVRPLLVQLKARTVLLWTTDVLRRVPFAALHDGKRYVLEEDFVLVQYNDLKVPLPGPLASAERSMAAFGLSRPVAGPPARAALANVPAELKSVAGHWSRSGRWLDTAPAASDVEGPFTLQTLGRALQGGATGRYQLLHVASHFEMVAGRPDRSALYLGDGSALTLNQLQAMGLRFDGFDLVTLSACSTAKVEGLETSNGQEMQSLGGTVLRLGARAVVATMWDVTTTSTGALMGRFYERLKAGRNKAEALRDAQLALLRPNAADGLRVPADLRDKGVDWRHPYYWAPMVLSGEWR